MRRSLRFRMLQMLVPALSLVAACGNEPPQGTSTASSSGSSAGGNAGSGGDAGAAGAGGIGGSGGDAGAGGMAGSGGAGGGEVMPDPTSATLLLQVLDTGNNPIPSAAVTMLGGSALPTDGVGYLLYENLVPGRFSARVERHGFAPASIVVDLPAGAHAGASVNLIPLSSPVPFNADAGAAIDQGNVHVTIPSGALVNQYGESVSGAVEATIVPLDPIAGLGNAPAPLLGIPAAGGSIVGLNSVFLTEITIWQGNQPVHLAPGRKATVEIVLPDAVALQLQLGQTIPAWWLDVDAGIWHEEGAGVVQASVAEPGKVAWVANLGHFTWWTPSLLWSNKNCFIVTVVKPDGTAVPNMRVRATSIDHWGLSSSSYTDAQGKACVEIEQGGKAEVRIGNATPYLSSFMVTGSGPASDCAGSGEPCAMVPPVVVQVPIICAPGQVMDCPYSGPNGTEGVGTCTAPKKVCNADGTEWSACAGEVLPQDETCNSPFDEDCDGLVNEGGDGCACIPGEQTACYTGPNGTLNVGICVAGTRTCDNGFFGACDGQVMPQEETCNTTEDDDCNGTNACIGVTHWSKRFGDIKAQIGKAVAVDGAGNVVMCGVTLGAIDLGGGPLGSEGMFLGKFDPQGNHLWSKRLGNNCHDVVIDDAGHVIVTGKTAPTDLGGGPIAGNFVAKFDANGNHLWSKGTGHYANDEVTTTYDAVAVDPAGNVVITGSLYGTVDFGGGPLASGFFHDIFAAKYDPNGNHVWSKRFGDSDYQYGSRVALDGAGNVVLTGQVKGSVSFGGPSVQWTDSSMTFTMYVVKLDPNGDHIWTRSFGYSVRRAYPVAIDGDGNVVVSGTVDWDGVVPIDFGCGPHAFQYFGGDIFVAKYGPSGTCQWSKLFAGNSNLDIGAAIAIDAQNDIILTGHTNSGSFDIGGGIPSGTNSKDVFVAKFNPAGTHLWSRLYVVSNIQETWSTAIDPIGNVFVTGSYESVADFGNGPMPSAGSHDAYLVKLSP